MKDRIVVFTKNNARVLVGQDLPKRIHPKAKYVVNPDLSKVKGVPLHYWKLDGESICELTPFEKRLRNWDLRFYGPDNSWDKYLKANRINYWQYAKPVVIIVVTALITHFLTRLHG